MATIPQTPEQKKLRAEVEKMVKKRMKRGDDVSEVQRRLDLDASFLWLAIEIDHPATARVRFHLGHDDAQPASSEPVEVELRVLKDLIETFDQQVMDRVFVVDLKLKCPWAATNGLALLTTIHAKVQKHKFKLHLTATETPIEMLIGKLAPSNQPAAELSNLQRAVLRSLTLEFINPVARFGKHLNLTMTNYARYFNTPQMQPIDKLEIRLRGCGRASDEIELVKQLFPKATSLHLNYIKIPGPERLVYMPSAEQWALLSGLPMLKHIDVVGRFWKNDEPSLLPRFPDNAPLANLETLALENVNVVQDFFASVPQLATLRIQHRVVDKELPKPYDAHNIDEVVNAIRNNQLRELETLHIRGPDAQTMRANGSMRNVCKTIVDNYSNACTKLQTLILDFEYNVDGSSSISISIVELLKNGASQFLAKAPLTIEIPQARVTVHKPRTDEADYRRNEVYMALRNLCQAAYHSGLHCLKLKWQIIDFHLTRRLLVAVLNRIKDRLPEVEPSIQNVAIVGPTQDSIVVDSDGNVETFCSIVWKSAQSHGSFEQRIELTYQGKPDTPQAATGQAGGIVVKQPDTAAAGDSDESDW